MKKYLIIPVILSLIFAAACASERRASSTRFESNDGRDPIESMRFLPRDSAGSQNGKQTPSAGKRKDKAKGGAVSGLQKDFEEQLKVLEKIPKPSRAKVVVVEGSAVTLRKGPGIQFKKTGMSHKGDRFKLLRKARDPKRGHIWYLVQDASGKKSFISSLFSTIKRPTKVAKEVIHKRRQSTLKELQSIADPQPPLPPELLEAKHITLNFEETSIIDVITTFADLLKIDYIIEGQLSGAVTLQTFNKIPVEDLYSVLEQILALHNFTVVKSGNFYRFLPIQDAVKKPLSVFYGVDARVPSNERLVIQIIPLKHISVESMKKIISPLLTTNASFIEVPETKNLMMIELASNVKRILKVVGALDIDKLASSDIDLYTIKHTDASSLVGELIEIFSTLGFEDAIGDSLTFLPLDRLNAILVVNAFTTLLPTIEFWIDKLDQPMVQAQVSTFVYYVQNGEASKLAALLNAIYKVDETGKPTAKVSRAKALLGKRPKTAKSSKETKKKTTRATDIFKRSQRASVKVKGGVKEGIEGKITIIPDEDTNALIVRTNPKNYPPILELLKKLDQMPKQVLIEVLILDVTVDEQTQAGLEWALEGKVENAGFSSGSDTGSGLGAGIGSMTSIFASPGFSFFLGNASKLKTVLRAFAMNSKANLISNPILVTSDNKAASISVTDEIPIQSTTITTPTAGQPLTQSTIEFRSVGVKLNILPKINSQNFVNLKIDQEISKTGPVIGNTTSFNTRSIQTEVVVKDNQVLVMGGLMQTNITEAYRGIPILMDIPILGALFRSKNTSTSKTELMIFIVPHVISNTGDADMTTSQIKDRLFNLKKEFGLQGS